ncbi:MAG: hypothetical protein HWE13_03265 [Gammaproteobacteria bacterium]|nr:hypothetical protein [Gammaproteobacteria bacterium]NVK87116.1 hypothetical protein [Gammaproteobacteria bacterium]
MYNFGRSLIVLMVGLPWLVFAADTSSQYSCSSATKLGYQMQWQGAQNGMAKSERGGHYWSFIGESIRLQLKTRFREDIGEFWVAHPTTDINYFPGNEYTLQLTAKKQGDHGEFLLNSPWFEGYTQQDSGFFQFKTQSLRPTDEPCIEGRGEINFVSKDGKAIKVTLEFALDITGRKYRK